MVKKALRISPQVAFVMTALVMIGCVSDLREPGVATPQ